MKFELKFHSGLEYRDEIKKQADEMIANKRLFCTFGYGDGPTISLDAICASVISVEFEDDKLMLDLNFLDTPIGRFVQALIDGSVNMELRPKGIGTPNRLAGTVDDYKLSGFYLAYIVDEPCKNHQQE